MLPDFPNAKDKVLSKIRTRFKTRATQKTGPFSTLRTKVLHEGNKWWSEGIDGSIDRDPLNKIETEMKISLDEIERTPMSFDQVLKKFDDAADDMGQKLSTSFYDKLNKVTEESGNVIDGEGKPLSPEKYLEVLETIQFDFNSNGEPELPTIVVHPNQLEQANKVLDEIFSNPKFNKLYNAIIEKERLAWRARENSRKLVG